MKIGFIGAGKVGCTLAKYFTIKGYTVAGFFSRNYDDSLQASQFTNSEAYLTLSRLVDACDCLFITVPDSQIALVWQELAQLSIKNKFIGHCSGLLTSALFKQADSHYSLGFSLHPLSAIYDRFNCYQTLNDVHFTLEASSTVNHQLLPFFKKLGNPIATLSPNHKALYHAACVVLSNHVVALAHMGSVLLMQCGLDNHFCNSAWHQLFIGNANNLCQSNPIQALTGPIERGDLATIQQHLAVLPTEYQSIYKQLSQILITISRQKHPEKDYKQLELELLL
ncbi:DUF2520 domain-containing protein [Orbaceae bacterium ac157xtp]